jgi:predicted nucleic acid-binding protein
MIVVDASAVLELLLRTPVAGAIQRRLSNLEGRPNAPHLVDVEVTQVLRRYAATGILDHARGRDLLAIFGDLPLQRFPHHALLPRVWSLRHNLTAYDAIYVALAETLDVPLLTHDRKLARSSGHGAMIELV